jgi:hypothetical protein
MILVLELWRCGADIRIVLAESEGKSAFLQK